MILSLLCLASCYSDDSTMPATEADYMAAIEIGDLNDVSAVSLSTTLNITPEVSGYSDSELSYAWYIYGDNLGTDVGGYKEHQIGSEKTLNYEVALDAGAYTLVLEVTHTATGYVVFATCGLTVTTDFSLGFYILKETTDGNTDVDIYSVENNMLMSNVIESMYGSPLPGAPCYLDIVYDKTYADPETSEATSGVLACVTSEDSGFGLYRTTDLELIFDRSSILFEEMESDEKVYRMCVAAANYMFTNKGVYSGGSGLTGKFSGRNDDTTGSSTFVQAADAYGFFYWDENAKGIKYIYDTDVSDVVGTVDLSDATCLATGWSYLASTNTMWYVVEKANGTRYLLYTDPDTYSITTEVELGSNTHLANADLIAGNALTASYLFGIDNNALYAYSLVDPAAGEETGPYTLSGMGSDEEITFIADSFFYDDSWYGEPSNDYNYIIVGTRSGENYKLYFYSISGGLPYGQPVYTVEGTGTVTGCRFVKQTSFSGFGYPNMYPLMMPFYGISPSFPYSY